MPKNKILLVEDNPDDEALTIRDFKKSKILNEIVVAHDGAEALDYLFGTGKCEERDISDIPALILLDLKLPKVDGLDVPRQTARSAAKPAYTGGCSHLFQRRTGRHRGLQSRRQHLYS